MYVVCVCKFDVIFTYVIEGIDSKVIYVCFINDYSLIADLHVFVLTSNVRQGYLKRRKSESKNATSP